MSRPPIQAPTASGNALSTKKLFSSMAPIRIVKIMEEVLTVSIRQLKKILNVIVLEINDRAKAPDAHIHAASSGEKIPL